MAATRKPAPIKLGDIDLEAFRRQKEQISQLAYAEISARQEKVQTLLSEIGEICKTAGVTISLSDLADSVSNLRYDIDSDWNSSGC